MAAISLASGPLQESFAFHPNAVEGSRAVVSPPPVLLHGNTVVENRITMDDGTSLHGYIMTPANRRGRKETVLFFHGNAGNVRMYAHSYLFWLSHGFRVVAYDYPGYGQSTGKCSEAAFLASAEAMVDDTIRNDPGGLGAANRTILHGFSLGTCAATHAAAYLEQQHGTQAAALVFDSGFTTLKGPAVHLIPVPLTFLAPVMVTRFDSISKMRTLRRTPVAFLHSPIDRTVPYSDGWAMYKACTTPKAWFKCGQGHMAVHTDNRVLQWYDGIHAGVDLVKTRLLPSQREAFMGRDEELPRRRARPARDAVEIELPSIDSTSGTSGSGSGSSPGRARRLRVAPATPPTPPVTF